MNKSLSAFSVATCLAIPLSTLAADAPVAQAMTQAMTQQSQQAQKAQTTPHAQVLKAHASTKTLATVHGNSEGSLPADREANADAPIQRAAPSKMSNADKRNRMLKFNSTQEQDSTH